MSGYGQNFPPNKQQQNSNPLSNPINAEFIKNYTINSITIKEDEKRFWAIVISFPQVDLWIKLVLLVINVIFPGCLNRVWNNDYELLI